jgi:ABC-type bacteriocin/lantibiotic exporter with double-glycine peptidase domain
MLLGSIGVSMPMLSLSARYPVGQRGMSAKEMMDVLRMCGARPRALRAQEGTLKALSAVDLPVIVHLKREHFVVVAAMNANTVSILDPAAGEQVVSHADFIAQWTGVFIGAELEPGRESGASLSPLRELMTDFLKENGSLWALLLAMVILVTVATVSVPWLLSRAVMMLAESGRGAEMFFGLTLIVLAFTMVLAFWMRARVGLLIQLKLDMKLTRRFVERLLHLPSRVFALIPTGDLLARVSAVASIRDFLAARLAGLVLDFTILITATAIAFYQSPHITLTFLALSGICSVFLAFSWSRYRRLVETELLANSNYNSTLAETLGSGLEIKVNRKEDVFAARLIDHFGEYQNRVEVRGRQAAIFDAIYSFQERIVPVAATMAPLLLIPNLMIEPLNTFYCFFVISLCTPSVRSIQSFCMQMVLVRLNADRMESIQGLMQLGEESLEPVTDEPLWSEQPQVEVDSLTFSYLGTGAPVLEGVSACFDAARLNVIIGVSGGGKSTLLKLIGGQLVPDKGRIRIRIPGQPPLSALSGVAAYLNQHPTMFSGTVAENISMFDPKPDSALIARCARAACIHDEISAWPLGYNTRMVSGGHTVSAGQCQRIALARLLYSKADVMLLDEFTSDIDPATERTMVENLREWPGMKIIVTHRTQWLSAQDNILNLGGGSASVSRAQDVVV